MDEKEELYLDYEPTVFLRCHSKTDRENADVRTEVWQLCFEPKLASNTIATCGGNKVCIINLNSGEVEQRYSARIDEVFFTLAWSAMSLDKQERNILVFGGKLAILYFVCPEQHLQIAQFPMSFKSKICSITFHPSRTNSLFCSTYSGNIHLLEVDLSFKSNSRIQNLISLSCKYEIVRTAICTYSNLLFAATGSGLYGWSLGLENLDQWNDKKISFKMNLSCMKHVDELVDSLEILNDGFIALKYGHHEFIYIWHVAKCILESHPESRVLNILPLYKLVWCKTDDIYLEMSAHPELGLLTCGDADGSIWLYNIEHLKTHGESEEMKEIEATKIIKWPVVKDIHHEKSKKLDLNTDAIIIQKAVLNENGEHLVAITNRNMVCLWLKKKKRTKLLTG